MTALDNQSLAFTLGFIAGEGSFYLTTTVDDRYAYNLDIGPRFSLTMGVYEEDLLNQFRSRFALGSVTSDSKGYRWVLSSRDERHTLRELIEEHVASGSLFTTSKKHEAFETWSEALDILEPGYSLSKSDLEELVQLKDDINYMSAPSSLSADELIAVIEDADQP
ncbi:LAGLIDADG family homing endonuclease [Halorussus limi]|uniref:LAGLIDADG family homing endonuclease n=1 Tax=Halorussus limi TaxID=2938695 RepID=A0A8U0HNX5_9EURY|nr:LAGLIDADG family homing endonuclease [Halorussus limi]UPV72732.1 LAGLIDADG family homing endonuclease [Halorussus limi]